MSAGQQWKSPTLHREQQDGELEQRTRAAERPSAPRAAELCGSTSAVSKIEAAHDKGFSHKIQQCNL